MTTRSPSRSSRGQLGDDLVHRGDEARVPAQLRDGLHQLRLGEALALRAPCPAGGRRPRRPGRPPGRRGRSPPGRPACATCTSAARRPPPAARGPAGDEGPQRAQGLPHRGGVVREVVVDHHAALAAAHLQAPLHPAEGGQGGTRRLGRHAHRVGRGQGGQRVAQVVLARGAGSGNSPRSRPPWRSRNRQPSSDGRTSTARQSAPSLSPNVSTGDWARGRISRRARRLQARHHEAAPRDQVQRWMKARCTAARSG